jgi:hypothetical protein
LPSGHICFAQIERANGHQSRGPSLVLTASTVLLRIIEYFRGPDSACHRRECFASCCCCLRYLRCSCCPCACCQDKDKPASSAAKSADDTETETESGVSLVAMPPSRPRRELAPICGSKTACCFVHAIKHFVFCQVGCWLHTVLGSCSYRQPAATSRRRCCIAVRGSTLPCVLDLCLDLIRLDSVCWIRLVLRS